MNEVRILASIVHPSVVGYKECFLDAPSSTLCIAMEYLDDGDLYSKILSHRKNNTNFHESDIWRVLIQVLKGLEELHRLKILHRDLKSANIFLSKDKTAKIGDLNVSKVLKQEFGNTQTGTPYYASPEVWEDKPYDS